MPANHCKPHSAAAKEKMRASHLGKPALWKRRETREIDGITQYRCSRCKGFFTFECFYKTKRTLLGIKGECKTCHIAVSMASRDPDKARKTNSTYRSRARSIDPEKYRARERAAAAKRRLEDHIKIAARAELNQAIRRRDIVRPSTCECCGENKLLHGHHEDYCKPLEVKWLCPACHGELHRTSKSRPDR